MSWLGIYIAGCWVAGALGLILVGAFWTWYIWSWNHDKHGFDRKENIFSGGMVASTIGAGVFTFGWPGVVPLMVGVGVALPFIKATHDKSRSSA